MSIKITSAPCCWGVDDPKNPHLPPWQRVLEEAATAGYKGIELGPYGYLPLDPEVVSQALTKHDIQIVAGTIFDNLVDPKNLDNLLQQTRDICALLTQLPPLPLDPDKSQAPPYLVIIDWGHPERDKCAGRPEQAPRLSPKLWQQMIAHIKVIATLAWQEFGVRAVIHPHAGGYIEYADEIRQLAKDIPHNIAGLCLDTGHLYYSKMDPEAWLVEFASRLDYIHFKDIDLVKYQQAMDNQLAFFDAVATGVMCPIGQGVINYRAIHTILDEINYRGYITVEQERDPRDVETSLQDVTQSRRFLSSVGFG
ncbi:MAG: TIM barrel protein [Gammaproteobacteria bacterium]|nr:TIM barrel protein [Gammaproteobacteria bacterium]